MTDYDILKRFGHSPIKAAEIALDAKRGDKHALKWLETARAAHPEQPALSN
jgi:hypothetical protein